MHKDNKIPRINQTTNVLLTMCAFIVCTVVAVFDLSLIAAPALAVTMLPGYPRINYDKPGEEGASGGTPPPSGEGSDPPPATPPPSGEGSDPPSGGQPPATPPDPYAGMSPGEVRQKKQRDEMDALMNETATKLKPDDEDPPSGEGSDPPAGAPPAPGDGADDDNPPAVREGFENDTVEIDGKKYYYHPAEHGKESGQGTTYPTRDDAEIGFGHKVSRIKELKTKLDELGTDVGAVDLPEWLSDPDSAETFDQLLDVDYALQLPNSDLRSKIKEADKLITHLSSREERYRSQQEHQQAETELTRERDELMDRTLQIVDDLGIADKLATFENSDALLSGVRSAVDKKVASDLKPLVEEYQALKNDENARIDDPKYADKLEEKFQQISDKRIELKSKYDKDYIQPFIRANEVSEEVNKLGEKPDEGMTEKQRVEKQNNGFIALQKSKQDDHPIFQSSNPEGANRFRTWAVERAEKFNGLMREYDWYQALKAFDNHLEERRAEIRKQTLEESEAKKNNAGEQIPPYGDQKQIAPEKKNPTKAESNKSELDRLEEETRERLKKIGS